MVAFTTVMTRATFSIAISFVYITAAAAPLVTYSLTMKGIAYISPLLSPMP
jgi:hypothetical protein